MDLKKFVFYFHSLQSIKGWHPMRNKLKTAARIARYLQMESEGLQICASVGGLAGCGRLCKARQSRPPVQGPRCARLPSSAPASNLRSAHTDWTLFTGGMEGFQVIVFSVKGWESCEVKELQHVVLSPSLWIIPVSCAMCRRRLSNEDITSWQDVRPCFLSRCTPCQSIRLAVDQDTTLSTFVTVTFQGYCVNR